MNRILPLWEAGRLDQNDTNISARKMNCKKRKVGMRKKAIDIRTFLKLQ